MKQIFVCAFLIYMTSVFAEEIKDPTRPNERVRQALLELKNQEQSDREQEEPVKEEASPEFTLQGRVTGQDGSVAVIVEYEGDVRVFRQGQVITFQGQNKEIEVRAQKCNLQEVHLVLTETKEKIILQ